MERIPEHSFLITLANFFISVDFILTLVSVLSIYTHLSHILIALTFISWGSSPIELINLTITSRSGNLQLGLTSILSSIVLGFYVILPCAILCKMYRREAHEIQILQPIHSSHLIFLPAIIVTVFTLLVFHVTKMHISKKFSLSLITAYAGYLGYMWC
jgi:Ca2+/Na+ antiporter